MSSSACRQTDRHDAQVEKTREEANKLYSVLFRGVSHVHATYVHPSEASFVLFSEMLNFSIIRAFSEQSVVKVAEKAGEGTVVLVYILTEEKKKGGEEKNRGKMPMQAAAALI